MWLFENKLLRAVFCLKRKKITGGWRGLLNEEFSDLGGDKRGRVCDTGWKEEVGA
jgi:hypothetical protein